MAVRFNRLHFFKRFDAEKEYIVLKNMTINGKELVAGTVFDKSIMPIHKVKRLFETRKITTLESLFDKSVVIEEKPLTNVKESDTIEPEIRQAGPAWMKVFVNKNQIGKTVRTQKEAEEIVAQWKKSNT